MAGEVAGEVAQRAAQGLEGRLGARGPLRAIRTLFRALGAARDRPRGQINETFTPSLGASSRFADVLQTIDLSLSKGHRSVLTYLATLQNYNYQDQYEFGLKVSIRRKISISYIRDTNLQQQTLIQIVLIYSKAS